MTDPLRAQVATALESVRRGRPIAGVRGATRLMLRTALTALGGLMLAITFGVAGALLTQSVVGGGIGTIVGLLVPLGLISRPHRDWRRRLSQAGHRIEQLQLDGPATRISLPIEAPVELFYVLDHASPRPEQLWLMVGLPQTVQFDEGAWRIFADDAPTVLACITEALRSAAEAWGDDLRIFDGQPCLTITGARWPTRDPAPLVHALARLAADLKDPPAALRRIAQSPVTADAARALGALMHAGEGVEAPLSAWVVAMLSGRVSDALDMRIADEPAAVAALFEVVPAEAWYAPLVYACRHMPRDEANALRAIELLNAVGSQAGELWFKWLALHGGPQTLRRVSQIKWHPALGDAGARLRAQLSERLQMHGALSVDAREDGGLALADQLSPAEE